VGKPIRPEALIIFEILPMEGFPAREPVPLPDTVPFRFFDRLNAFPNIAKLLSPEINLKSRAHHYRAAFQLLIVKISDN
jgi:hypothetical protein